MKKPLVRKKVSDSAALSVEKTVEESVDRELEHPMIHCVICGSDTQAASTDRMCWVCRRLKISAWRDNEQQAPAQE